MTDWPDTNPSLIHRVKDTRDDAAWNALMALYRPVVYRLARRHGLDHENAEDVVQNVFTSVSRSIQEWETQPDGPRFRNWLGRVTRNASINAVTRGKPDRATGTSSVIRRLCSIPNADQLTEALRQELRLEAIRYAASQIREEFSEKIWGVFCATTMDGRPAAEVADAFECSIGTVYVYRCRVTARLREKANELADLWENNQ